jgi:uncharacterized protein (DUF2164 family)
MAIKFQDETRTRLVESIKRYFREELDDEIGELKASLLLDFVTTEIGASVYNQAVRDVQARLQEQVTDLDGQCFQAEFSYWK